LKKYGKTYYGFNTNQAEYIYNSLKERDFYFYKYKIKTQDFNAIVEKYDEKIENLNNVILLKDSIINDNNIIIDNKENEMKEKETTYKKQLIKEKVKSFGALGVGIIVGVVITLLIH